MGGFFFTLISLMYTEEMENCECLKPKKCSGCPPDNIPVAKSISSCYCPRKCEEPYFLFKTQIIPASMGNSVTGAYKPANGMYKNMLVRYEADGSVWIYDSAGVYTNLKEAVIPVPPTPPII